MDSSSWGFEVLPKEVKQLIFSFTNLGLVAVFRLQSVSSEFKKLCWTWMRVFDSSLLANKERTPIIAAYFLTRVAPVNIRKLNLTNFEHPLAAAWKYVDPRAFPNLEEIELGNKTRFHFEDTRLFIARAADHPKLLQIKYEHEHLCRTKTLTDDLRHVSFSNVYRRPTFHPFFQQKPKAFRRSYHRGGPISEDMFVIGAVDGTLTFLTFDTQGSTDETTIYSTDYTTHRDCINTIIRSSGTNITYIASLDGIVSSWSCVDNKPVLQRKYEFMESIQFVCQYAQQYVLAAGKQTLYISEIETMKIVNQIAVDDDITGLVCMDKIANLSTNNCLYACKEDSSGKFELVKGAEMPLPNIEMCPDGSLLMVVNATKIDLVEQQSSKFLDHCVDAFRTEDGSSYDVRPYLSQFAPSRYWMTASMRTTLVTFDLERNAVLGYLQPGLTFLDTDPDHPPSCNAFWYSPDANSIFCLCSNDTLYWWRILRT